eukprot:scaffold141993_cov29-Tisochrysis_lutea.AAC.2
MHCRAVRSFLELSSAEQLFNKLQEKEHFLNLSILEKDKALEQQRMRVAALSGEYGRAQSSLQELQSQLREAARERESAKAAADAALDLARQQVLSLEKALALAQAETAEAAATKEVVTQQLAIQTQLTASAKSEADAQRAEAAAAMERLRLAEEEVMSTRDALATAELQLREMVSELEASEIAHAEVEKRASAAEAGCAEAEAIAQDEKTARHAAELIAETATTAKQLAEQDAQGAQRHLEELEFRHQLQIEDLQAKVSIAQQELRAQAAETAAAEAARNELKSAQEEAARAAKEAYAARLAALEVQRDELRAQLSTTGAHASAGASDRGGESTPPDALDGRDTAHRGMAAARQEAEALRLELASAVAEAEALRIDLSKRSAELARVSASAEELRAAKQAAEPSVSTPTRPPQVNLSALTLTPHLPTATETLSSLQVHVAACVKKEEGGTWWWVFQVRVTTAGLSYLLVRRFSQFVRMHERLRALPLPQGRLPPLPPKRRYATQTERFAEDRRAALDVYLKAVVADRDLCQTLALQGFLELGALLGRTASLLTPGTDVLINTGFSESHTR